MLINVTSLASRFLRTELSVCGRVSEVVCVLRMAVKELACDRVLCTGVCEVCAGAECCEQQVRKECVCVCVCVCVYTWG